ncbi:DUF4179 domain-containing protein [Proteiniclasticum sp. BAD-10]|uniref:DUF4179 domain-containing protein n=1 Tax=Proteiniclasticum sediminis TaxID=2804028 RepID=A0A941HQ51_9CLOT|nr:DUF4179 domain-containing protein [Proteiniclasticum sediminis]MBR0576089.1 DUF4179 domain-containing protein [Proteiniclasticum sediminis]
MKSDNHPWNDLVQEVQDTPPGLLGVEERLSRRLRKRRRTLYSALTTALFALTFVTLVNTNTAFANTLAKWPVIGDLTRLVRFTQEDRGIQSAIENQYLQELALSHEDGGLTLDLPYVIADEHSLVLIFQLPEAFLREEKGWIFPNNVTLTHPDTKEKIEGYAYSSSSLTPQGLLEDDGLFLLRLRFADRPTPQNFDLTLELAIKENPGYPEETLKKQYRFDYELSLPTFLAPVTHVLNQELTLLDQQVILESLTTYPTGTEITFRFPDTNTAWIKDLELSLDGANAPGGISAFGSLDGSSLTYFLESDYFSDKPQTLKITALTTLPKTEKQVLVDLERRTLTPEIPDTYLLNVTEEEDAWILEFRTFTDQSFSLFYHEVTTLTKEEVPVKSTSISSTLENGVPVMLTRMVLEKTESHELLLPRHSGPARALPTPLEILIPRN